MEIDAQHFALDMLYFIPRTNKSTKQPESPGLLHSLTPLTARKRSPVIERCAIAFPTCLAGAESLILRLHFKPPTHETAGPGALRESALQFRLAALTERVAVQARDYDWHIAADIQGHSGAAASSMDGSSAALRPWARAARRSALWPQAPRPHGLAWLQRRRRRQQVPITPMPGGAAVAGLAPTKKFQISGGNLWNVYLCTYPTTKANPIPTHTPASLCS